MTEIALLLASEIGVDLYRDDADVGHHEAEVPRSTSSELSSSSSLREALGSEPWRYKHALGQYRSSQSSHTKGGSAIRYVSTGHGIAGA
eukprot:1319746-Rhodomonas_salina.1